MNILDLTTKYTTLHKAGAHMVGPCPKCGGKPDTTRFVVNIAKNFAQCYSCGGNWDVLRWLKDIEGMTCPEAHRHAGLECEATTCPVWDKCSKGKGDRNSASRVPAAATLPPVEKTGYIASPADDPAALWAAGAQKMVELCHTRLLECPEQLTYLAGRGLPLDAVKKYHLGWIPKIEFRNRKAWGLPDKEKNDGSTVTVLPFPQGILIPWFTDQGVHRLRIRKTTVTGPTDPRYLWVDGSGNDIICLNPAAKAHLVVESDLDGLLVDWLAGDLVGAIPLGSCSTKPKATVMEVLRNSLRILVALDYDHEQREEKLHAPGAKACHWWFKEFPDTARRWPVPVGKDPGEAYAAGCDLRAWVVRGLPVSLQMRAAAAPAADNEGQKKSVASLAPEAAVADVEPEEFDPKKHAIVTTSSHDGREIRIAYTPEVYDSFKGTGKAVFTGREVNDLKSAELTPAELSIFTDIKELFDNPKITKVERI